ncbi:nucleotide-binding protein [Rhodoferax sp.]|uniref:nucleotide-binding protein n=1 Tax=Rhodoferax sp. TaxID=50421 RepID=UPI002634AEBF|nr:nucleotide-binding protein [Rhodoferax sp.]MDD2926645.1 nucleotide-binding protein [Rhodoferax sp.]
MNIKLWLAPCLALSALLANPAWSAQTPMLSTVTGEVLEVREVEAYTYLRLKTQQGETWAAVNKVSLQKGAKVTIENVSVMENFESKTLKKTFATILFGTLGGTGATNPHTGASKAPDIGPVNVPKASGPNAYTVAEVVTQSAKLKDKPVRISGKVVKYNAAIMGKNWIHLRDGSGAQASSTHDILVTTTANAKLGEVLTVSGMVRADKDFGAGYSYKVLIEDATLQR